MYLDYYLEQLDYKNRPEFLNKYLTCPSIKRLKKVGYFCGMDYASKDVYNFREYISRFDHSLTVALLVYKLTQDKTMTIAGLVHDIATPSFSHVIDYMNKDYEKQESTEEYTEEIIKNDTYLLKCLKEDKIAVDSIINFKWYSVVDNERPKLCADRIDGIILTAIGWTKNINKKEIKDIIKDLALFKNESLEDEIGFKSLNSAKRVMDISNSVNVYCHSAEDNYMMQLLSNITKLAIDRNYLEYKDLYILNEKEVMDKLNDIEDKDVKEMLNKFKNIKKEDITLIEMPKIKERNINILVNGKRFNELVSTK